VTDEVVQLDAFITPGSLLREARKAQGMTEREAADRLNFMPNYVAILERDDYAALRSPPFARGYVKAYGRLLGLDEKHLLSVYDAVNVVEPAPAAKRVQTRPLQLQRTGLGVVTGLGILLLLILTLWWWEKGQGEKPLPELNKGAQAQSDDALRFTEVEQ
jgi:cytoskeletal protein RodZ